MERKRAFIHIGMPKAGSSAIQRMLGDHVAELKAAGLFHPDTLDSNRPALMEWFPKPGERHFYLRRRNISERQGRALAEDLRSRIRGAAGRYDIVLSSEYLFNLGARGGDVVAAMDDLGFDALFVCYLRHPVNDAISSAQQSIKLRHRTLEEACREPRWHRARGALAPLIDAVGKERLLVLEFDAAREVGVAQHFLNAIGYGAVRVPKVAINESLTMDGVIFAERHRRETEETGMPPFRRRLIFELGGSKFTLPESALQQVREGAHEEVAWVAETFGITLREQLPDASFRTTPTPQSVRIIARGGGSPAFRLQRALLRGLRVWSGSQPPGRNA